MFGPCDTEVDFWGTKKADAISDRPHKTNMAVDKKVGGGGGWLSDRWAPKRPPMIPFPQDWVGSWAGWVGWVGWVGWAVWGVN